MKRRDFVKSGVAVGAVLGVAREAEASTMGSSIGGTPEGFRLVSEKSERRGYPILVRGIGTMIGPMTMEAYFTLDSYVVECPYPLGSKAWVAISDRDESGLTIQGHTQGTGTYRRVVFPRFQQKHIDEADLMDRAHRVYRAGAENGFDTARGPDHTWKVVHVEYRCTDGVEHTMAAMPETWDSRLALGVMVKGQIS